MNTRTVQRLELLACAGFAGALLLFLFFYATKPISDPDFWWHLKSGEMMVQNGGLLQSDPFTFTADGVTSTREALILKGYWLWQFAAYGFYALLGLHGVTLFNFIMVLAMVGVVVRQLRRQQVDFALTILLLSLGFYLLQSAFFLERPQVVSFLLMTILLGLLARVREEGDLDWRLPLLMTVWANLHGGYVVGDLVLICFAAGTVIEYWQNLPRLRHLLLWIALGIGASLLSPSGVSAFVELFSFYNGELMKGVGEYKSTWIKFQEGSWTIVILWLLITFYGLGIWKSRRFNWPDLFVFLFISCFSVAYVRNIGFFAVAMLPGAGFYLQQGWAQQSRAIPVPIKYLTIVLAAVALLWQANVERKMTASISAFYPEKAAQFILDSGLQGRMFNGYNFGGYLIWKLYPSHRVFIDGRGMDIDVYRDYKSITSASLDDIGGRKEFEVLLDRYGIDYVMQTHIFSDTGRLTPLLKFLLIKSEWIPVYVDQQAYILVRNSQRNAAVIARYRMDKGEFNNKVVGYLKTFCKNWPMEIGNHVALAEMLIFVGRYAEAEERLAVISLLQPDNLNLPALRNQLSVLKNEKKP